VGPTFRETGFSAACSWIPTGHLFRLIRGVTNEALKALDEHFATLYSDNGPAHRSALLLLTFLQHSFRPAFD
jgi:hypothetical protein